MIDWIRHIEQTTWSQKLGRIMGQWKQRRLPGGGSSRAQSGIMGRWGGEGNNGLPGENSQRRTLGGGDGGRRGSWWLEMETQKKRGHRRGGQLLLGDPEGTQKALGQPHSLLEQDLDANTSGKLWFKQDLWQSHWLATGAWLTNVTPHTARPGMTTEISAQLKKPVGWTQRWCPCQAVEEKDKELATHFRGDGDQWLWECKIKTSKEKQGSSLASDLPVAGTENAGR